MGSLRPVLAIQAIMIAFIGLAMLLPIFADYLAHDDYDLPDMTAFMVSSIVCILVGAGLALSSWSGFTTLSLRANFLISGLSWISVSLFAALPLMFGNYHLSFTDAVFEVISGLTTTGATVLDELDTAPPGLLLWRSILHWIGGIGIILMAIAILPMLKVGGMQLFRLQSSDTTDKPYAAASQIALGITAIYTGLTLACFLAYWAMGMGGFDAINHAMATIATGGFSTKNASFGYFFENPNIHGPLLPVASLFMILSALPFGLYLLAMQGRVGALWRDAQVRFYLGIIIAAVLALTIIVSLTMNFGAGKSLQLAMFNGISIITGTGFAVGDYSLWGPLAIALLFCLTFIGGCAGSASCGLKVFRFQVALKALREYGQKLVFPHAVIGSKYNQKILTPALYRSVLMFFFIYFTSFATVAVLLSLLHLDPVTAISAAAASLACVGPGFGDVVGPAGNYASLPDAAKWVLAFAMLLGRLEFFTVLVFFTPGFWRP